MEVSVAFTNLAEIPAPEGAEDWEPTMVNVLPVEERAEFVTLDIKILRPALLIFNKTDTHTCSRLIVDHMKVSFQNMTLKGGINSHGSNMVFNNCTISGDNGKTDYLICVSNGGVCKVDGCVLENSEFFGIGADEGSSCDVSNTVIRNCGESLVSAVNASVTLTNCVLRKSKSDLIVVEGGHLRVQHTTMSESECFAIFSCEMSDVLIENSTCENNAHGGLAARKSNQNEIVDSLITDSNDTSVLLEEASVVLQRVKITKCNGNGVNAQDHSHVVMEDCVITETKWPSAAFCGGSEAFVRNTVMEMSEMSGFVVRDDSKVTMDYCVVKNCVEDGARICDSLDVVCQHMIFSDCGYTGAVVSDGARAKLIDCVFSGGFESAINVYGGSFAMCRNITILGPMKQAIWVHLGGSVHMNRVMIHPNIKKPLKFECIRGLVGQLQLKAKLDKDKSSLETITPGRPIHPSLKIDTEWSVIMTNMYIIGTGNYQLLSNVAKERTRWATLSASERIPANCCMCKKPAQNHYLSPCGHCIYCKECWDAADPKPTKCELCHFPIGGTAVGVNCGNDDDDTCAICWTNKIDSVFLPCGHLICKACAVQWLWTSRECPFCRNPNVVRRPIITYK